LRAYTRFLCELCYGIEGLDVKFGNWAGSPVAFYERNGCITYNVRSLTKARLTRPVSKCTSLVLHELAHCCGKGHDGVYDHAYEASVDTHTVNLARSPKLYKSFEPELFTK
jgi:hypothetical protein